MSTHWLRRLGSQWWSLCYIRLWWLLKKDMAGATTMINNQIRRFTVGETQIIGQGKLQPSLWKFAFGVTKGTKPSRGLVIVEQGFIVEYGVQ